MSIVSRFIPNNSLSLLISPARNFIDFDGFFHRFCFVFKISLILFSILLIPDLIIIMFNFVLFCFPFSAFLRLEFRSLT